MLVTAGACIGNAVEVAVFPAAVAAGGLRTALILAAVITLSYALFAIYAVPETRGRTPEEIYNAIYPLEEKNDCETGHKMSSKNEISVTGDNTTDPKVCSVTDCATNNESKTVCTKL